MKFDRKRDTIREILQVLKNELVSSYDEGNIEIGGISGGDECAEKILKLTNEYVKALWRCSVIFYDVEGNMLGWFPCKEGSDNKDREEIAEANGIDNWHVVAMFHSIRIGYSLMMGQIKGNNTDEWWEIDSKKGKPIKRI